MTSETTHFLKQNFIRYEGATRVGMSGIILQLSGH